MRYRIHQVKLAVGETTDTLAHKIIKKIGDRNLIITDLEIIRESIDARDKKNIKFVYTVDFSAVKRQNTKQEVRIPLRRGLDMEEAPSMKYLDVVTGETPMSARPVIVGFGPCGMFAGLILARRGYRPVIIERGSNMDKRVDDVERFWKTGSLNTESNVQFGEGGAGTFSDGKLTTGIKDMRIRKVLEEFVRAGAGEDILYKHKPHIGTDVLRTVVKNIRKEITRLGGEVRFDTRFAELKTDRQRVTSIIIEKGDVREELYADSVVLAIGHSARDTFRYLSDIGVKMIQKPFSIGVRIEHSQHLIDKSQYGDTENMPPADYKLSYRCSDGRGVYTFCMCPGGEVIVASSQTGGVVTNGMSNRARDSGRANSALLVDVRTEDFGSGNVMAGVEFQEKYEKLAFEKGGGNYRAPVTSWGEFRDGSREADGVISSLPQFAVNAIREAMPELGKKLRGFDSEEAVMTAVETRSSSPVRFERGTDLEGTFEGLYPAGEGAGYAGGIMSAACDGIKAAEKIIAKYSPVE